MRKKLNISKTVIAVISLNILQITASIGVLAYALALYPGPGGALRLNSGLYLIFIIIATALISSIVSIKDTYIMSSMDSQYHTLHDTLDRVEKLNNTLRAQRHDFMNHLQVVYSLMEMEEYKDAMDYIDKVYMDIQKVGKILKTSNAAINALLQAKILDSEKHGIDVRLLVTSQLKELKVPAWEMCRVLGNLIDNAIDALSESEGEKYMEIEIFEDLKSYGFRVKNNGPVIPESIIQKIFKPGFTTKGDKGEGMGLAISTEIMHEYGGEISVCSDEKLTVFEGHIPKQ